jgi:AcrR family transcriptional regulator
MDETSAPADAWREYGEDPGVPAILSAALALFVDQGYHGTTTRELAAAAGLSVPGVYHHYPSKQAMLVELMRLAMGDLYARSLRAQADAGDDVARRFDHHVECLVLFHAHRGDLAYVAANEIRALEPAERAEHVARRDRQQRLLDDIVAEGVARSRMVVPDVRDTSRAVVTMCTGVAQWYRLDGPLRPDELAREYVTIARRMVALPDPRAD